jgi:hypothetical protein
MLRRQQAARATKNAVGLRPLCGFSPPHFARPGLCFAKPLFGLSKRRIQPERYAQSKFNKSKMVCELMKQYCMENILEINFLMILDILFL